MFVWGIALAAQDFQSQSQAGCGAVVIDRFRALLARESRRIDQLVHVRAVITQLSQRDGAQPPFGHPAAHGVGCDSA